MNWFLKITSICVLYKLIFQKMRVEVGNEALKEEIDSKIVGESSEDHKESIC